MPNQEPRSKQLVERWRELVASGGKIGPQKSLPLDGRFQHWPDEASKLRHLQQVKEAQQSGAPF